LKPAFAITILALISIVYLEFWGDPGVDGRIILGWIFGKWDVGVWTGWS